VSCEGVHTFSKYVLCYFTFALIFINCRYKSTVANLVKLRMLRCKVGHCFQYILLNIIKKKEKKFGIEFIGFNKICILYQVLKICTESLSEIKIFITYLTIMHSSLSS
jgi:hypothetical protein